MKKNIFFSILALLSLCAAAQNKSLNYFVAIHNFQKFYNAKQADSLYAMYAAPMKAALQGEKNQQFLTSMHQQLGMLNSTELINETAENCTYKGVFEKATFNIILALNDKNELAGFFLRPAEEKRTDTEIAKSASNFNAQTAEGKTLFGTLQMPENKKEKPNVVLLIAGSGPTDRNCNSSLGLKSNAFIMIADSLSAAGIASVRYDKRGVGESSSAIGSEADTRFNDMVNDAIAFIKKIKAENKFGKIFVAGHSEGSLVGMMAAQKEKVDGFISIAGVGEGADKIMSKQIKEGSPNDTADANLILNSLKKGKTFETKNENLSSIFHTSVQPYLISWFAYDPQIEIKKLNIPILIIQGKTDLQVGEEQAQLLKTAQPKATLILVDGMNHVLKLAPAERNENLKTYNMPELPISSIFSKSLIDFCK